MTIDEVNYEVSLLTIENVKNYPLPISLKEDFYTMWQKFGPQAARTFMIPPIWNGVIDKPSEVLNV